MSEPLVKCTNCGNVTDEESLPILEDSDGKFKGCKNCLTDAYLMDLEIDDVRGEL